MENSQQYREVNKECITLPHPYELDFPIIDTIKNNSIFPEEKAMLYLEGEYQTEEMFELQLGIQTEFNKGCVLYINPYNNIKEQLKFLKDLNRMTHDAIKFIERNNLQQRTK